MMASGTLSRNRIVVAMCRKSWIRRFVMPARSRAAWKGCRMSQRYGRLPANRMLDLSDGNTYLIDAVAGQTPVQGIDPDRKPPAPIEYDSVAPSLQCRPGATRLWGLCRTMRC